jgi:BirA family biotin operon repressor/biotin-[acetyl-CoA-carboxylase] ligase
MDSNDAIEGAREVLPPFFDAIEVHEFLPSTMIRAGELAAAGAAEGTTVIADVQTAGRGRLGRTWVAPPGSSLMLSVVLRPALAPGRAWLVAAAAGVALADAAAEVVPGDVPVALKWPNDLLVGGVKAAGMLAEARPADGVVILGMGVNVGQAADDFPDELRGRATSLSAAAGAPVGRVALLAAWGGRFAALYRDLGAGGSGLLPAWRARLATLGTRVRVERVGQEPLTGRAVDVGASGELVLELPGGATAEVLAGDVEHLRPATG